MMQKLSRREFVRNTTLACAAATFASRTTAQEKSPEFDFTVVDYHVHYKESTFETVMKMAVSGNVKFGIVEHAGTKENPYPGIISNDDDLRRYLARFKDDSVFKGIQTEWTDWSTCFSVEMLSKLDYVLTDAMTWPGPKGERLMMWEEKDFGDPKTFMDRYVAWIVKILDTQPVDIFANVAWIPDPFAADYDTHWTESRMSQVIEAALKHGTAIEISSGFNLPKMPFLKLAKAAGIKFSFGSNLHHPKDGQLNYSLQMAHELGLKKTDLFTPAPDGQKAVQRRIPKH